MIDCRVKVLEQMAMDVCEQLVVEGELSCAQQLHDARADLVGLLGAAGLLRGQNCHVNLIPVNPIKERDYVQSDKKAIEQFKNYLERHGINATVRREMGRDIGGACGQLRKSYLEEGEI